MHSTYVCYAVTHYIMISCSVDCNILLSSLVILFRKNKLTFKVPTVVIRNRIDNNIINYNGK